MSSISMLQKAGTTSLPSSLATRKLQLPISKSTAAEDDHYSSSRNRKTSSAAGGDINSNDNNYNDESSKGIRRRLSLNKLQDSISSSSIPAGGSFGSMRSKSTKGLEHAGSSIRKWWELGWSWILSTKPQDVAEINNKETSFLGSHNKATWLHLFYKLRSEFDKLLFLRSSSDLTLPRTIIHINSGVSNKKPSSFTSGGR